MITLLLSDLEALALLRTVDNSLKKIKACTITHEINSEPWNRRIREAQLLSSTYNALVAHSKELKNAQ